jgi:hypothetical protein
MFESEQDGDQQYDEEVRIGVRWFRGPGPALTPML